MIKSIYKKWWVWILAAFLVIIIWAAATGNNKSPLANKKNAANPGVTPTTDIQQKDNTGKNKITETTSENHKIEFKNLLLENNLGMSSVYGEVTNNNDKAHSFTIKVSFYDSNRKLLGSAAGAVNDLNSGSTKTFSAVATEDYSHAVSYKADVDTMVSSAANKKEVIVFSNLITKTNFNTTTVDGEAKNTDTSKHSFTIVVSFYDKSSKLIGVASGAVNDLAPGQIKTFSAISTKDMSGAASNKVQVDTLVE